jgi:hypothetical protein
LFCVSDKEVEEGEEEESEKEGKEEEKDWEAEEEAHQSGKINLCCHAYN